MEKIATFNYKDKLKPLPPSEDRVSREASWLEIITFGLYKTKEYIKRENE
jgi:hypothetical protein